MFNADSNSIILQVVDRLSGRVAFSDKTFLWSDYFEDPDQKIYSIPKYIDQYRHRLRDKYEALLYRFGEERIGNERIVDWFSIRPGFSYWWMTLIVESNYGKSSFMTDQIKLLAFEEILEREKFSKLVFNFADDTLNKIIKKFCKEKDIVFLFSRRGNERRVLTGFSMEKIYRILPFPIKASITFFRYILLVWGLRKQSVPFSAVSTNPRYYFFDYFIHLNADKKKDGRFGSNYWTRLVDILRQTNATTFWSHIFIPHSEIPNSEKAVYTLAKFNLQENEIHSFLEGLIDPGIVLKTLLDYIRINLVRLSIFSFKGRCRTEILDFDLWPILKNDYLNSLSGPIAVQNLFFLNLIEAKVKNISGKNNVAFYLQENQAWEMALLHVWKRNQKGPIFGVPHATIRFWDLRYFSDSRNYVFRENNCRPLPDQVALNGPAAVEEYQNGNYPKEQIQKVEALRYLGLSHRELSKRNIDRKNITKTKVLILTDYLPEATILQMQMLLKASTALSISVAYEFKIKSHPAYRVHPEDYTMLHLTEGTDSIADLLLDADIAYTSGITSAAVDAYCSGVPVISTLDGRALNMSPLLGKEGVVFVSNADELAKALETVTFVLGKEKEEPMFYIDQDLPRWKKLLRLESIEEI
ncbi:carbohydrate biosynthesis protein [Leptospira yasudae]|uniref:TIGR04326 family surface carbohydrate biosynthesis protein n=1 Tax=Leptospira yasudae TaxID=2202201 RepID=UPI001C4E425F|nr:TIGR04326 family surface carbohydrate biosynthesis protein [Leptospira yasudae]MBW0434132.1 carbohydrate biosynthesis protein [Leptospira yasudae]